MRKETIITDEPDELSEDELHEAEYPRLYAELRSLLERYGHNNVAEALDNLGG